MHPPVTRLIPKNYMPGDGMRNVVEEIRLHCITVGARFRELVYSSCTSTIVYSPTSILALVPIAAPLIVHGIFSRRSCPATDAPHAHASPSCVQPTGTTASLPPRTLPLQINCTANRYLPAHILVICIITSPHIPITAFHGFYLVLATTLPKREGWSRSETLLLRAIESTRACRAPAGPPPPTPAVLQVVGVALPTQCSMSRFPT